MFVNMYIIQDTQSNDNYCLQLPYAITIEHAQLLCETITFKENGYTVDYSATNGLFQCEDRVSVDFFTEIKCDSKEIETLINIYLLSLS